VAWNDGWPAPAEPIEPPAPATFVEELPVPELPPTWVAPGRFPGEVLQALGDGWRLTADGNPPTFVGRRQQHLAMRVQAWVRAADGAGGLELRIDPQHAVSLEVADGAVRAIARIGAVRTTLGELVAGPDVVLELRTEPCGPAPSGVEVGPDVIVAGLLRDGRFEEIGRIDGRYFSTEVAGGFTGRMVGVCCSRGHLEIRSFRYIGRGG
jgi:xylan 1,4-beta-xylosidase